MATGLLSKGITLEYMVSLTPTALPDLQEIPELGGDVDKVEVTTLADGTRRYINGIKDYGDLAFTFLYDGTAGSSWDILSAMDVDVLQTWVVTLPDAVTFTFDAFPSVKLNSAGVNDPLTFTLNLALNGEMLIG